MQVPSAAAWVAESKGQRDRRGGSPGKGAAAALASGKGRSGRGEPRERGVGAVGASVCRGRAPNTRQQPRPEKSEADGHKQTRRGTRAPPPQTSGPPASMALAEGQPGVTHQTEPQCSFLSARRSVHLQRLSPGHAADRHTRGEPEPSTVKRSRKATER